MHYRLALKTRLVILRSFAIGTLALGGTFCALAWNHGDLLAEEPRDVDVRMVEVDGVGSSNWSRWRGPSGQGFVVDDGYPDRWSDTNNVVWKADVPGSGNSSPIIWSDRVFVTAAYDQGRRLSLLSYSVSDGRKLWETEVPSSGVEHAHDKNGHASATPVTDGKAVYASFGTHGLMAVDLDGQRLWHQKLEELDNYHGSAGSPVLYGDKVILYQDHRGESFVTALEKTSGKPLWRTAREAKTGWGTPIVINVSDAQGVAHDELIVSSQARVQAYNPNNGRELWRAEGNKFEVIPTPVVAHGLVFCSSGRAGPTLAIRPGGSGNVTDTHVVWQSPKGSPFVPSPIVVGDNLYMVNDMLSIVTAHRARTGELVFQGRLGTSPKEGFSASPVNIGDKIFFTNDDGDTFVIQAGDSFRLLHVNKLNARTLASPALVDGNWYFRTERELIKIGKSVTSNQ